jgi:hypothetical protein
VAGAAAGAGAGTAAGAAANAFNAKATLLSRAKRARCRRINVTLEEQGI